MSQQLCLRGRELFSKASLADDVFKARLLEFFASVKKDDQEMKQIEILGDCHKERQTRRSTGIKDFAQSALKRT